MSEPLYEADLPVRLTFTGRVSGTLRLAVTGVIHVEVDPPTTEPPQPPPFIVGETYPDETTVGAGIIRPLPTTVVPEYALYDEPGNPDEPVRDLLFMDRVKVTAPGWVFENCYVKGPEAWTEGGNLVDTTDAPVDGKPVFRYCTICPQTPDPHWNGIGYRRYRLEMCRVYDCTDDAAAFARSDEEDKAVHVEIVGTWLGPMSQFKPDLDRDVTHDDNLQAQGNDGAPDDILVDGSRLDAYHDPAAAFPSPPEHTQVAAIMLSPNTVDRVCLTVTRSWLSGGIYTINAGSASNVNSTLVVTDNIFEAPHEGGPTKSIVLDPSLVDRTIEGNVYEDGSPVPVSGG